MEIIYEGSESMNVQLPKNVFSAIVAHKEESNASLIDWDEEAITIPDELLKKFKDLFGIENDGSFFCRFLCCNPVPDHK